MKVDWERIIDCYWQMYDPLGQREHIRPPGSTEDAIRDVERSLHFEFPPEFHEFYLVANGLGIDSFSLLPLERIPRFVEESRVWLSEGHPDIARQFYPFIDNKRGPLGYFVDASGELMPYMILMARDHYHDDPRFDPEAFMEPSAQSIWEYLTC